MAVVTAAAYGGSPHCPVMVVACRQGVSLGRRGWRGRPAPLIAGAGLVLGGGCVRVVPQQSDKCHSKATPPYTLLADAALGARHSVVASATQHPSTRQDKKKDEILPHPPHPANRLVAFLQPLWKRRGNPRAGSEPTSRPPVATGPSGRSSRPGTGRTMTSSHRPYHRNHDRMVSDLAAIRSAATPLARDRLIEAFLKKYAALLERLARGFSSRPHITWANDGGDLIAIVTEVAWRMLLDVGTAAETPPEAFAGVLASASRSAIRGEVESGKFTTLGGATGAQRRQRSMRTTAAVFLVEHGRHPSIEELVDSHNKRSRSGRANPVKQGALVSEDDLIERKIIPTDPDALSAMIAESSDESSPLTPAEMAKTLEEIFAACAAVSVRTEQIAKAFCSTILTDSAASGSALGRLVGWSESTINRELKTVLVIARQVFSERHGFCGPEDI